MILELLKGLKNEDGATLKNYESVSYRTGYQVATEGDVFKIDEIEAAAACVEEFGGDCGLWVCDNLIYVDKSQRVSTLKKAIEVGKKYNQISILKWSDMSLIYL